jgi:hypothetical protein
MRRKRNIITYFLIFLRTSGMLCKKYTYRKPVIKVSKTIYPEGKPQMSLNGKDQWYGLQEMNVNYKNK